MPLIDFKSQLKDADSVPDLARRLGAICLKNAKRLGDMFLDEQTPRELERIEMAVGQVSLQGWEEIVAKPSSWEDRLGAETALLIEEARMRQPLDFLGVLRGLCLKALEEFYLLADGQVGLDEGMPVRFAYRPIPAGMKDVLTPKQETLNKGSLLRGLDYSLFPFSAEEQIRVVLDFSHREQIDELTWREEEGLPPIATLHPQRGGEVEVSTIDPRRRRFFDVVPKHWDEGAVLDLLAAAKQEAEIAVLPELSLPSPDALAAALAAEPGKYPSIVVAGSAHVRNGAVASPGAEIRSNESHVYLEGKCVAVARKHHPYETKKIGDKSYQQPLSEDLTGEQKTIMVLSGRMSRLAVAICADLDDDQVPRLLQAAGVNLLLVPAMTKKIGAFNPPICAIAGFCQGIAAIVNTRWDEDGKPFLCMLAVPREAPGEQSIAIDGAAAGPTAEIGIFDPNQPLSAGVRWR